MMDYVSIRDIAEGEEICINYNGVIDDRSEVWFEVITWICRGERGIGSFS